VIIYSIIPMETIFQAQQEEEKTKSNKIIEINNIKVEARFIEENIYEIQRVYSTNAQDYLQPWLQPGTRIRLSYQIENLFPKNRWSGWNKGDIID